MVAALLVSVFPVLGYGAIDTASNGTWNSSGTWSSGTTPGSNDTLYIPAGVTVNVNCNCGTYSNMHIIVFGTLNFPGGRKINLSSNGLVDVYTGGTITGSNNGDKINIDGSSVWTGSQADINGPSSCNSSGCNSNPTLPVELLWFNGAFSANGEAVILKWATATETSNDYFTVEASVDRENWGMVGFVKGYGNTTEMQQYEVRLDARDVQPLSYFRLNQTDFNGQQEALGIIAVEKKNLSESVRVYPNPSSGEVSIQAGPGVRYQRVLLMTSDGRLVLDQRINGSDMSVHTVRVNKPGVYSLRLYNDQAMIFQEMLVIVSAR